MLHFNNWSIFRIVTSENKVTILHIGNSEVTILQMRTYTRLLKQGLNLKSFEFNTPLNPSLND